VIVLKKRIYTALAVGAMVVVSQPVLAVSGACERLMSTATGSWTQGYWYAKCAADSIAGAWELFHAFF
jgi:hypothetical protein